MNAPVRILINYRFTHLGRRARCRPHSLGRLAIPFLIALIALLPAAAQAQAAVQAWAQRYAGPGSYDDCPRVVAVDSDGNVFVVGTDGDTDGYGRFATIKYSSKGVPLWINRYPGPGSEASPYSAAVDADGSVFVTGYCATPASCPLAYDYVTIKYSSKGMPLWTNRYSEPGYNRAFAYSVAVNPSGDVFVTGSARGTNGYDHYATLKYSNAGEPVWTNCYHGPGKAHDGAAAVVVDAKGNVLVTGASLGTHGDYEYATIKYSSAGVPLWTNRYHWPGNDASPSSLAVDPGGNVVVTGTAIAGSLGIGTFATIKCSSAGVLLWTNAYADESSYGFAYSVAVDADGNAFVTGLSWGRHGGDYNQDYATIKYSGAGIALWTNRYNGPGNHNDTSRALAVDASGNAYVTGGSAGDYATLKYSSAGVPLWTNRYSSGAALALAVDACGNVYVTGCSPGSGYGGDFVTVKYVTPPVITNTVLAGTNLVLAGTVGSEGGTCYVLASTNMAEPMTNWERAATNTFAAAGGSFNVTNALDPARPFQYFRLEVP